MFIATTNSTNTLLKQLAAEGNPPEFIYAGYQIAGRGQTGNSWESEEGKNLLCSILLPPNKDLYFLNIAVSVAIIRLIGGQFTIKWPNDIYYYNKKLAGILLENAIVGSESVCSATLRREPDDLAYSVSSVSFSRAPCTIMPMMRCLSTISSSNTSCSRTPYARWEVMSLTRKSTNPTTV